MACACRCALGEDGALAEAQAGDRAGGAEHEPRDGGEEGAYGLREGACGLRSLRGDVGEDARAEAGLVPEVPELEEGR